MLLICCIGQLTEITMWITIVASFVFGIIVKYFLNLLTKPCLEIEENIVPDYRTKMPYIKVCNKSVLRWHKAYDLQFYLTYYQYVDGKYEPFHTGSIADGVIKSKSTEKYSIMPTGNINVDLNKIDYKVGVVLIYRNGYSTYSIIEKECYPDKSAFKNHA